MCGILGVYALNGDVTAEDFIRALETMRERGTHCGAGVAFYSPSERVRVKAFAHRPIGRVIAELPGGVYDVELDEGVQDVDGFIYLRSRWVDLYKVVGWPGDILRIYGLKGVKSKAWIGHTRYPTNSPGRMPYFSQPFSAGDVVIAHNGDLSSYGANVNFIRYKAYAKFTGNDSEAIAFLMDYLRRDMGIDEVIEELMHGRRYRWARLDGPYAVVFLIGGERPVLGAFVDPQHFRPLYVGVTDDLVIFASEICAIRALAKNARYWALRAGEYIIVEDGEIYGRFRRRYVHPDLSITLDKEVIDASAYGIVELAHVIRRELRKKGEVNVINVNGHRYIGNGMEGGVLRVWGVVGNASANVMSGGYFFVYGDVQDDFGDVMNGGIAVIYGNAGDTLGQSKRGGEIYVYGDVGTRAAIQHRGGVIVIGGSAGKYLGEYMGGGVVVVLRATNDEEVGDMIARGMVGGEIYIRGEVPLEYIRPGLKEEADRYVKSLILDGFDEEEARKIAMSRIGHEDTRVIVEIRELSEEELNRLSPYIDKFNKFFNMDVRIDRDVFTIIKAVSKSSSLNNV